MTEILKTRFNWCKGLFKSGDTFEKQFVLCYRERWICRTCGTTFAKREYLDKHRENQHNVKTISTLAKKMKTVTSALSVSQKVKSVDKTGSFVTASSKKEDSSDQEKAKIDNEMTESSNQGKDRTQTLCKVKKVESLNLGSEENSD